MGPLIISVSNHKGGVAKTTTAVTLADLYASERERVLVVDLDPQGNATQHLLGEPASDGGEGLFKVLGAQAQLAAVAVPAKHCPGVFVTPAGPRIEDAEASYRNEPGGGQVGLRDSIAAASAHWDVVIIDCPPTSKHLLNCSLAASHGVLIPCELEPAAIKGLAGLTHVVQRMRAVNPHLRLAGIFATKVKSRRALTNEVWDLLKTTYGPVFFESYVRDDPRVAEADGYARPVTRYKPGTPGSKDYRDVFKELRQRLSATATAAA